MQVFDFPFHTQNTEYPESGTRVQLGGGYIFTAPPNSPDLRRFSLKFPTMFYYQNQNAAIARLTSGLSPEFNAGASPDGGYNATKVTVIDGVNPQSAEPTKRYVGANMIFELIVKYGTGITNVVFSNSSGSQVVSFDLTNNTANNGIGTVQVVNSGWVRLTVTVPFSGDTSHQFYFSNRANIVPSPALATTSYILLWGANPMDFLAGGNIDLVKNPQTNMAVLEKFYNFHKMNKTFIYPHPIYGNLKAKFYSPLKIPEGIVGGNGALKDFTVELIEIV